MEISRNEVLYVIEAISNNYQMKYNRDPFNYFIEGHCYVLAAILENIFPDGCIMDNDKHIVFKLNDQNYDIRSICSPREQKALSYIDDDEYHEFIDAFSQQLIPDDKNASEEVIEYLTEIGMMAKENYENKYLGETTSPKQM